MPRLSIGTTVKVIPTMKTVFTGAEGVIDEILPHERGVTVLDRYVVTFKWGEKQTFYDAQLAAVETSKHIR